MRPSDLKAWRISLCLSQQLAADALGMSRYGYQQLENGTTVINRRTSLACAAIKAGLHLKRPNHSDAGCA